MKSAPAVLVAASLVMSVLVGCGGDDAQFVAGSSEAWSRPLPGNLGNGPTVRPSGTDDRVTPSTGGTSGGQTPPAPLPNGDAGARSPEPPTTTGTPTTPTSTPPSSSTPKPDSGTTAPPRPDAGTTTPPRSDAGTTTPPQSDAGTAPPSSTDPFAAFRAVCLASINQYRSTLSLPALTEATPRNTCVDGEGASDAAANRAHASFGSCSESAQNSCPGYPGDPSSSLPTCLGQMWNEGPGTDFATHGHYINMTSTAYKTVSCGFYKTADNRWWMLQDFYR